jgi:hypothetical protein
MATEPTIGRHEYPSPPAGPLPSAPPLAAPVPSGDPAYRPYTAPRFVSARLLIGLVSAASAIGLAGIVLALPGQIVNTGQEAGMLAGGGWAVFGLTSFVGGILLYVGAAALAISVPLWSHRSYRNLACLGANGLRWSPGWAAGGWFIPFGNLVICPSVIREIWAASGSDHRPDPLVWLWWAYWLIAVALVIVGLGSVLTWARGVPLGLTAASAVNLGLDLWPVSWGLLALLGWRVLERQEARLRELATEQ